MKVLVITGLGNGITDAIGRFLEQKAFDGIISRNGGFSFESSTVYFDGLEHVLEIAGDNSKAYLRTIKSLEQDKKKLETKVEGLDEKIGTLKESLGTSQKDKETIETELVILKSKVKSLAENL